MRKLAYTLALAAALVCPPRAAGAATAPVGTVESALTVTPGRTCLDERRLEGHVRAWLGTGRVAPGVHVVVEGDPERPNAAAFQILRDGKMRERRFDALPAGCEESHAAIALAIALAIDASVLRRIAELPPPAPPLRLVTAQLGLAHEVLPGLSLGGTLGLQHELLEWLNGVVELTGQHSRNNVIEGTSGRFHATLVTAALRVCAGQPLVTDALTVSLCSGASAGAIHAEGADYTQSRSPTGVWGGALTGVRVDLAAGLRWVLDANLVVPLRAPSFRVHRAEPGDAVRAPKIAGLLINLGPAFVF